MAFLQGFFDEAGDLVLFPVDDGLLDGREDGEVGRLRGGGLFRRGEVRGLLAEGDAVRIVAEQGGAGHEGVLHRVVVGVHDGSVEAAGEAHREKGAVDERAVRQAERDVREAHRRGIAEVLAVERERRKHLAAGVLVRGDGHDEGVEEEVALREAVALRRADDVLYGGEAIRGSLWHAVLGDGQAEDGGAVFLRERQELADARVLRAHGVDEGAARIDAQAGLEGARVARVDDERRVGDLGDLAHGALHGGRLVDAADAHVDVEEARACLDLVHGLFLDGEQGAFLDFRRELLAARGVDALADEDGRQIPVDGDGAAAARELEQAAALRAHGLREAAYAFGEGFDVRGCRAAAAAEVGRARREELRPPGAEFLRPHGEAGLAVLEERHAGVRLDADGGAAARGECLDDGDELLRAERAVDADDVRAEAVEDDGGGLRIRARDGASVLAVGELADDGEIHDLLRGEQRGAHLLDVDAGLDDEVVRARVGKGFCLLAEAFVGLLEAEVTERLDEAARRAHRARDLGARAGRLLRDAHSGGIDFLHAVCEAVVVELQPARAEGVRLDDGRAGRDVFLVDGAHDLRRIDVHELGAGAGL